MSTMITSDHDPVQCYHAAEARAEIIKEIRELICKYQSGQYYTYPNYSELSPDYNREGHGKRAHAHTGHPKQHHHKHEPGKTKSDSAVSKILKCICTIE